MTETRLKDLHHMSSVNNITIYILDILDRRHMTYDMMI